MVVEEIHVEDIFKLVSLALSLNISWKFRILVHEEDKYTAFVSIALKQTKAGPRSSRTPFLVSNRLHKKEMVNAIEEGCATFTETYFKKYERIGFENEKI